MGRGRKKGLQSWGHASKADRCVQTSCHANDIFSTELNMCLLRRARSYLKAVSEAQWELQHSSASRRPGLSSQPSQVSPTRRMADELTLFLKGSSCCIVVHSAPRRGTPVAVRGPTSCWSTCRSMRRIGSTGLAPPPPGHEPPPKSRYAHSQALVVVHEVALDLFSL